MVLIENRGGYYRKKKDRFFQRQTRIEKLMNNGIFFPLSVWVYSTTKQDLWSLNSMEGRVVVLYFAPFLRFWVLSTLSLLLLHHTK